jgi:single-stranded-DNA-specific exonuclease
MPSGPDGFVADPHYQEEFAKARGLLLGHPGRWRIIYHYDADGIASASSLLRALQRLGYPAQATPLQSVERERMVGLLAATKGPVIIVDSGASWLDLYPKHPNPVIVLDHHKYAGAPTPPPLPPHVAFVNPLDWGVDGMSELCGATLTWLFTVFLDSVNWDNAPWGLSGAIGDRQHVGGFVGLSKILVEEAVRRSQLVRRAGVALFGPDLATALTQSIDPYFPGLSGRRPAVEAFLQELGIPGSHAVDALPPPELSRLVDALQRRLTTAGVQPEFVGMLDQPRWFVPSWGLDAEELSNLQSAAGRVRESGVGVALSLGDPGSLARARDAERRWRTGILNGLRRVEDGGVQTLRALRWFESPEMELAGTQAGLAINYLLPPDLPVFVWSNMGPDPIKVSSRGVPSMVAAGLDLSVACRTAAHAVRGEGGGHRIASGATIPPGSWPAFLDAADRALLEQLNGRPGFA